MGEKSSRRPFTVPEGNPNAGGKKTGRLVEGSEVRGEERREESVSSQPGCSAQALAPSAQAGQTPSARTLLRTSDLYITQSNRKKTLVGCVSPAGEVSQRERVKVEGEGDERVWAGWMSLSDVIVHLRA